MSKLNRTKGCLMGLAVGDALGTTLEFNFRDAENVTDIVGGGPFNLLPGQWTDDTSMALCLGNSLLEAYDIDETAWKVTQLQHYVEWYNNGLFSSTGECFDIGHATSSALFDYMQDGTLVNNSHERSSGNGSLMRLAPIAIYYNPTAYDFETLVHAARESSSTTHNSTACKDSCAAYAIMMTRAIVRIADNKEKVLSFEPSILEAALITNPAVIEVLNGSYKTKTRDEISSSGYVVDSLEAALWAFHNTDNFADAVLLAANLGDDADTVAAITGQLAGAYYGLDGIPAEWVDIICMKDDILELAENLTNAD